jgi:hypothetical protein
MNFTGLLAAGAVVLSASATNAGAASNSAVESGETKSAPTTPALKGHEITYRMASTGLVIEVDGLKLEPKAVPVKTQSGWIVKLAVSVEATDEHTHSLLSPEGGPLMVATEITKVSGTPERISDTRKGDTEIFVSKSDGNATSLDREVMHPITSGQSLTLYVGLWGLGKDHGDRKPLKKLFTVKMVAGAHKPQPVVTAPE